MDEREVIRKLTPRLILADLERLQCLVNDLEEAAIEQPLELSPELKEINVRLLELTGQITELADRAAQETAQGSDLVGGNRLPSSQLPDAS